MNIVFVGMPGTGKSTIGKKIAEKLNKPFVDVDNFILAATGIDTADHLEKMTDDEFLDFEAKMVQGIEVKDGIIATSGSVPLRKQGIDYLRKNAVTIWMDVPLSIIKGRLGARSDGYARIVGAQKMTFEEILNWREKEYQKNNDIRFTLDKEMPKDDVVEMIFNLLKKNNII